MSVDQIIEQIRSLDHVEYAEVMNRLNQEEEPGMTEAIRRDQEMESGGMAGLGHEEVFAAARRAIRCG